MDVAFIQASLFEEVEADAAALAEASAAGITVMSMGAPVKSTAVASASAAAPAAPAPAAPKIGSAGKSASVSVSSPAAAGGSSSTPPSAATSQLNHRLLPHVLIRLDAAHDMALMQRLTTVSADAAGTAEAASTVNAAAKERFERRLRRYHIHNAAKGTRSVSIWFSAATAESSNACPPVISAVPATVTHEWNINSMTADGLVQAAQMAATDARLAAMQRMRALEPLLAGVKLPEEDETGQQQQQQREGVTSQDADVNTATGAAEAKAPLSAAAQYDLDQLDARTAPARARLMEQLVPHISAGIVRVCTSNPPPANPVQALAQYLMDVAAKQQR